ncbi:hypothetical protein CKF46_33795, partial [Klebsiella pneumoniae]
LLGLIDSQRFRGALPFLNAKIVKRLVQAHCEPSNRRLTPTTRASAVDPPAQTGTLLAARQFAGEGLDTAPSSWGL